MRYTNVHDWLRDCRAIVRKDLDNLILFSGAEGVGKSTIMFQVMRALDPTFDVSRVFFRVEDFTANAPAVPRYHAVAMDEALINRRKSMHKTNVGLLDYVQVCRGLNQHMAICFPHDSMLDRAIADFRVRYNVHVPSRGMFHLRIRSRLEMRSRFGEERTTFRWLPVGSWRFRENAGEEWEAYKGAKEAHMRSLGALGPSAAEAAPREEERRGVGRPRRVGGPDPIKAGLSTEEEATARRLIASLSRPPRPAGL